MEFSGQRAIIPEIVPTGSDFFPEVCRSAEVLEVCSADILKICQAADIPAKGCIYLRLGFGYMLLNISMLIFL